MDYLHVIIKKVNYKGKTILQGGKAFKRPAYSVAVPIVAYNYLVPVLKYFIANALKYKAHFRTKFE